MRTSTNGAGLHQRTQQASLHISSSAEGKFAREIRANTEYCFTWNWTETWLVLCTAGQTTWVAGSSVSWGLPVHGGVPYPPPKSWDSATPPAPVAWLLCCADEIKQGGRHLWVLPGNSLVPNAKLGRHDSTFIVYRMNLFSLVKNTAYRFVLPFGQAADLIIRLKRIVNDQKKKQ